MSGKLKIYIGPMFAGKSTSLLKDIRELLNNNMKVLVVKSSLDDRYNKNKIVTHNKDSEDCIVVNDLLTIINNDYDAIVIDEAQFIKNLKTVVIDWVEKFNKYVVIGGLDGDYKKQPIGEILDLIPYSDELYKLSAFCNVCKDKAHFTLRLVESNEKILIGGSDLYIPVCRKHYK